jgi:hypothetical protein
LPTLISETLALLSADPVARSSFNVKLLHAGYLEAAAEQYKRTFSHASERLFLIDGAFPRLTRVAVTPEIRQARYELDVDTIKAQPVELGIALDQLGVI